MPFCTKNNMILAAIMLSVNIVLISLIIFMAMNTQKLPKSGPCMMVEEPPKQSGEYLASTDNRALVLIGAYIKLTLERDNKAHYLPLELLDVRSEFYHGVPRAKLTIVMDCATIVLSLRLDDVGTPHELRTVDAIVVDTFSKPDATKRDTFAIVNFGFDMSSHEGESVSCASELNLYSWPLNHTNLELILHEFQYEVDRSASRLLANRVFGHVNSNCIVE